MLVPGGRLYEQREAAFRAISKIEGLSCVKNKAAFYIFPKLDVARFGITDDKKFALDLLHAKKILLVPGSGFDWQEPDHFRVVMLPEAAEMEKAMLDIGDFLADYHQ
jgi:alanine-synthesizing transaminase